MKTRIAERMRASASVLSRSVSHHAVCRDVGMSAWRDVKGGRQRKRQRQTETETETETDTDRQSERESLS